RSEFDAKFFDFAFVESVATKYITTFLPAYFFFRVFVAAICSVESGTHDAPIAKITTFPFCASSATREPSSAVALICENAVMERKATNIKSDDIFVNIFIISLLRNLSGGNASVARLDANKVPIYCLL